MLNYKLDIVSKILKGKLSGDADLVITSVSIDSRLANASKNQLFFALVGERHNGHHFIADLYSKGIRAFVISQTENQQPQYPEASFIFVDNTLMALQQFAAYHRSKLNYPIIGITGSNGKTIVKEWLAQLLSFDRKVVRSPKSYNSQVGVALSVLGIDSKADIGILEAGISKLNEMAKLEPIVKPQIGIFTNLGTAHQENFDDLHGKAKEKMLLFKNCDTLIYSSDYMQIDELAHELEDKHAVKLFTWSYNKAATVQLQKIEKDSTSAKLSVLYKDKSTSITIPFSDSASIENAMLCITTLFYLGHTSEQVASLMGRLQPVAMRLEIKEAINGCTLINDSYNSDLGSLSIALDLLAQQRQHTKRMLIISDILQSGLEPSLLYSKVATMIDEKGVDKTIGIGNEIVKYKQYFKSNTEFYPSNQEFLSAFARQWYKDTAILLKGSRVFQFERISAVLEHKLHKTQLEIDLNALVHNLNYFRGLLKPNVKVMVMVKAFSYGIGSHEIANLLQFHRVDSLGVAFTDEGIALREAGITLPIVVLNPEFGSYDLMIEYNLEPEIFSFSSLDDFTNTLSKHGVTNYPIHLKIDTGMHRLGFMPSDIAELCSRIKSLTSIKVASIFSHLVATDDSKHDKFTHEQVKRFELASQQIIESIGYKPMLHILNSAGIERFSQYQFDAIRLGIGLYGISSVHQKNLMNVSTLKTFVAQLHKIETGETVGYNRTGIVNQPSVIATIPIGYADGLNRKLSNGKGSVMVNGKLAPIIGNISMDTCMIDVTQIPTVHEGDEVIIFGNNPSIIEIAKTLDTIPYEVLTSISRRVKRIYVQE
ncbi:MAG: bifunctional UDP-N-acetylmuramoyl-tripeptide:D-alanyl-D-alanine ligase/alanine racemase [Bacteroidales bacterium]|nr:bifunctional UDP-N-acetylmuramoyl-tripeptide:D-alanyl-D-alanine ligase/alanine racemase [Bacteroidales bacterium]